MPACCGRSGKLSFVDPAGYGTGGNLADFCDLEAGEKFFHLNFSLRIKPYQVYSFLQDCKLWRDCTREKSKGLFQPLKEALTSLARIGKEKREAQK